MSSSGMVSKCAQRQRGSGRGGPGRGDRARPRWGRGWGMDDEEARQVGGCVVVNTGGCSCGAVGFCPASAAAQGRGQSSGQRRRPQDRDAVVQGLCVMAGTRWLIVSFTLGQRRSQDTSEVGPCGGIVSDGRSWWPVACGGWKHSPPGGGHGVRVGCPM